MLHAEPVHRVIAQQLGELCRIEVITVVQGEGVIGNLQLLWGQACFAHSKLWCNGAGKGQLPKGSAAPMLGKVEFGEAMGEGEGVIVGFFAPPKPASEQGALFHRGRAVANKIFLGDADLEQGRTHRRPCSLAHTNRWS